MSRRLPQKIRNEIERARRAAALERCSVPGSADMKLYLNTWVVWPLDAVLRWADGDDDA